MGILNVLHFFSALRDNLIIQRFLEILFVQTEQQIIRCVTGWILQIVHETLLSFMALTLMCLGHFLYMFTRRGPSRALLETNSTFASN